jgi:Ser-tRNA(Ala) deacylase AlaX
MPQEGAPVHTPFYPSRGGAPRRGGHVNGNGFTAIDEKLGHMSIQDVSMCFAETFHLSDAIFF